MKAKTNYPIPVSSRIFKGLTREQAEELLTELGAITLSYSRGEEIIRQWTPIRYYYVVVSGSVTSFDTHEDGRGIVTGSFQYGDTFGLVFAFSDLKENPSSAVADEDTTVIRIPIVDIIINPILTSSEIHRRYLQNTVDVISQSAYTARLRAFVVSQPTIEKRMIAYLRFKSAKAKSTHFDIPLDRQNLADYIECDRSALSSVLGKMKKRGLIDFHKRHFDLIRLR